MTQRDDFVLLEKQLRALAAEFPYPRTPDIATGLHEDRAGSRAPWLKARVVYILILATIGLAGFLALAPTARAAVWNTIRLSVVRIFLDDHLEAPEPAETGADDESLLLDIAGRTTLAEAQRLTDFELSVPECPPDLGPPDDVFIQDPEGSLVVMVWKDALNPEEVRMSLHTMSNDVLVKKYQPRTILETSVNGEVALWTAGPYLLWVRSGDLREIRLMEGRVLIWQQGGVTYRLETDLALEEAVRVAESLEPFPGQERR